MAKPKKKLDSVVKLQLIGGQATPAPPIGPALGSKGVKAMDFCKIFNEKTKDIRGEQVTVVINIYEDKTFDFVLKSPPASTLLLKAVGAQKGSPEPNRKKIGKVTWDTIKEIAEKKFPDLNCFTIEAAMRTVAGTARSCGIEVEGTPPWEQEAVNN